MKPKYRLTEDGIIRANDGKLVATLEGGEMKPTAPGFHRLKDELKEFMGALPLVLHDEENRATSEAEAPSREGQPPETFLGDRTPEVLAWRRKNWTKEQFENHYGERFSYREEGK